MKPGHFRAVAMSIITIATWVVVNTNFLISGWTAVILFVPYMVPMSLHLYAAYKLIRQMYKGDNNGMAYTALIFLNISYLAAGLLIYQADDNSSSWLFWTITPGGPHGNEVMLFGLRMLEEDLIMAWYAACFVWFISLIPALSAIKK